MKKNISIVIALLALMLIAAGAYFFSVQSIPTKLILNLNNNCQTNGGNWLDDYQECENANQYWCEKNNGKFFSCESACRHNSDAEICTKQCVPVCKFATTDQPSKDTTVSFDLDHQKITLTNGYAELAISSSTAKQITSLIETTEVTDLNDDHQNDSIVILSQTTGGSGTFYYAAAELSSPNGLVGTNAILLGDRIAPQNVTLKNNIIIVNYAEHAAGQAMSDPPTLGVSKYFGIEENQLKEIIYQNDLIKLASPAVAETISSPLIVSGQARGNWFFEASFPVILTDWDGKIIAQGIAQAQGDWMTTDFVPFKATLTFDTPSYGVRGSLILKKDNPSGLPQNDDALEIPVFYNN